MPCRWTRLLFKGCAVAAAVLLGTLLVFSPWGAGLGAGGTDDEDYLTWSRRLTRSDIVPAAAAGSDSDSSSNRAAYSRRASAGATKSCHSRLRSISPCSGPTSARSTTTNPVPKQAVSGSLCITSVAFVIRIVTPFFFPFFSPCPLCSHSHTTTVVSSRSKNDTHTKQHRACSPSSHSRTACRPTPSGKAAPSKSSKQLQTPPPLASAAATASCNAASAAAAHTFSPSATPAYAARTSSVPARRYTANTPSSARGAQRRTRTSTSSVAPSNAAGSSSERRRRTSPGTAASAELVLGNPAPYNAAVSANNPDSSSLAEHAV
eukprot:Rhum_TRINITY_DN14099_c13_g2::Rhum_TRINITY_DN14099_c13_g2_i1::g.67783::m.67783